ncbi:MAG: hypothetical protein HY646_00475 [Acidobacteria bacterium]|nr:hypothetical protein [Acidobacteriota bacterium]
MAFALFIALLFQSQIDITLQDGTIRVIGWPDAANLYSRQWPQVFVVSVDAADVPPVLGSYRMENEVLVFLPRYPVQPGLRYRATLNAGRSPIVRTFEVSKPKAVPTTDVENVFPSANIIPENQLKLYLHFSAPMSRGEAYERTHLLDENGKKIVLPFLELPEELWDQEYRRLTILFDPGRIKRGLVPNEEVGSPLVAGRKYTLVIDSDWKDAEGKPLKAGFTKTFSVGEADRKVIDLRTWKVIPPKSSSREALSVEFPEPLDRALLQRQLEVTDSRGNVLKGSIRIDREEMRWSFVPDVSWNAGDYSIRVGTILADLAGNMIDRLFDVDVFEKVDERIVRETKLIPFSVK